jgi:YD repeat-containing protein
MRRIVIVGLLVSTSGAATAQDRRHEDVEAARPELRSMTVISYDVRRAKLLETYRGVRTYDARGLLSRVRATTGKGLVSESAYTWDSAGRLTSRTARFPSAPQTTRTFTYRLDTAGRIAERIMRDPNAPAGEHYRDAYRWNTDGSYTIQTYRHYATEGPYKDYWRSFDAAGRLDRSCSADSFCELIEYDAHGYIDRIRQQNRETHYYLVHDNTYDKRGRLATRTRGATTVHFTWNPRGHVTEERAEHAGAVVSKTVYRYDYR